ncbi:MAG: AbrB/MazE/SpoVT family DNA-binding domain-containing protein [Hydrogenobaculum sp.]|nr:MAG: AbrB/MazE/SpoVT family DNA-binding domain-containing protein [Hydrogenobaculum sp.]PMP89863.1 MAG: AbrB/MazE/SpoVT family DNA-binding domain-containing protein [Hydrogenobaculum sp.]
MLTKVHKWGNSLAIRIPKSIAREFDIDKNSIIEIVSEKNKIVIKPVTKPKYTIEELVAGIKDDNVHKEIDTGHNLGSEIW